MNPCACDLYQKAMAGKGHRTWLLAEDAREMGSPLLCTEQELCGFL